MANLDWGSFTLANFTVPKAFGTGSEGPDTLALGSVLTAVVNGQALIGTPLIDQFNTGGRTGVAITGNGENDVITVTAGSTATTVTDLTTGDQFNVTDVLNSTSGAASGLAATTTGFTASASTSNTTGGNAVVNTNASVVLTAAAAGATIDMSLAGGNLGYTLNGGAANDTLVGSRFADVINGTAGTNTITGGPGADALTGGAAVDTFVYNGNGDIAPGETVTGGGGADILSVTASATFAGVTFAAVPVVNLGSGVTATLTDAQITGGAFTTVNGVAAGATETAVINVASGATLSIAVAAATNVTLVMNGAAGNETMTGDADGPTTINGNAGNDALVGGTAADTLSGGDGADAITGAAGADSMSGGAGADTFAYGALATVSAQTGITLATADLISDFVSGTDFVKTGTAGTAANYAEAAAAADFATAQAAADTAMDTFVLYYLTSTAADGGLLFADSNADGTADAMIKLTGITSANFALTDIVA